MATFRNLFNEFDGSGDLLEAQREVIETLEQLAISKADLFKSEIELLLYGAGSEVDKTVPISIIKSYAYTARAFSSTSTKDIAKTVAEALNSFLEGGKTDIIKGIEGLLTKGLEIFFGSSSGASATERQYFIYPTQFSIYRIDVAMWYRMVTASAIQTKINKAIAVAYVQSVVDIEKIQWSDFIGIYGLQLQSENLTEEEIDAARQSMKNTWNFMKNEKGLEQDAVL